MVKTSTRQVEPLKASPKSKFKKSVTAAIGASKLVAESSPKRGRGAIAQAPQAEIVLDVRRRFLFDDKALRRGGSIRHLFEAEEPPEQDFNDVVDLDDRRVEVFVSQELVGTMIESIYFRIFIFGLIVVNSILIAVQTIDKLAVGYRYVFGIFDQFVFAIFVCEILLKWYYGFRIFWKVGWNIMDFLIILALFLGPQLSFLSSSRILRILRVLRAFRSLRSISALAGLSMVVQTILQSVPDMANIVVLLFIILVVLGVSGVTLFSTVLPSRFGDLPSAMFALFVCVTQDGWVEIFNMFRSKGRGWQIGGAIYFLFSITIGAFVFANLVVAVVVTNLEFAMKELKAENAAEVDVFAEEIETHDDFHPSIQDGQSTETNLTVIPSDEAHKGVDHSFQMPLQLNELKGVSVDKLQKYYLVLIALEENYAEYMTLKNDLEQIYEVVKQINAINVNEHYNSLMDLSEQVKVTNFNTDVLKKGDILSNLMKLEEDRNVTSLNAHNIRDVIRSAAGRSTDQAPRPALPEQPLLRVRRTSVTAVEMDERRRRSSAFRENN